LSEPAMGLSAGNFALTTAGLSGSSVASVTGGPITFDVAVNTGTGNGTLGLDMVNAIGATDDIGNSVVGVPLSGEVYDVVLATAPKVQVVTVNDGSAQRSRVTSVSVTFNQVVNLPANPADAFTLRRQSDGATVATTANVLNGFLNTTVFL